MIVSKQKVRNALFVGMCFLLFVFMWNPMFVRAEEMPQIGWDLDANGKLSVRDDGTNKAFEELYDHKEQIKSIDIDVTTLPIKSELFARFPNLESATIKAKNVTGTSLGRMFQKCPKLQQVDLSGFSTADVMSMYGMFEECSSLVSVDLSGLNTSKVADMGCMFKGCGSLVSLDVSKFDTQNSMNMQGMFYGCSSLKTLDVSGFDTSKVLDVSYMFYQCKGVESLDVSKFSTVNVTNFAYMFSGCTSLTTLDFSSFQMANAKYVDFMIACMEQIYDSNTGTWKSENHLKALYTPKGLSLDCALPVGNGYWTTEDSNDVVTILPKNFTESVKLIWRSNEKKAIINHASASFEGRIELNFYLRLTDAIVNDSGAKVVIKKVNATPVEIPVSKAVKVEEDGTLYCFIYPVVAKEIRDNVNIRVYDGEGNIVTFTNKSGENDYTATGVNYSVYTYATRMLENGDDAMKVLAQALIDYGTAAQINFKYGDYQTLTVSDRVTSVTLNDMEGYAAKFYDGSCKEVGNEGFPTGMTNRSISVVFEADNTFKLYYEFDQNVNPLPAEGNGPYTFTIDGNPATLHTATDKTGTYFWLELDNTPANRLGKVHDLSISEGTTTYTVQCSALAYARSSVINGDEARQNLGKALHLYYIAAKGKFGE